MSEPNAAPAAAPADPLAALEAEAHRLEGGEIPPGLPGHQPQAPAQQGPGDDKLAENEAIFEMVFGMALPWMPERYSTRYGDKERAHIARAWTVLEHRRGWDLAEALEGWAAELAFAAALIGPVAAVAMKDIRAAVDDRKRGTLRPVERGVTAADSTP